MKFALSVIVVLLLFAITACGGANGTEEDTHSPVQPPAYTPNQPSAQDTSPPPVETPTPTQTPTPEPTPEPEPPPATDAIAKKAVAVSAGHAHTMVITPDGTLWGCA